MPLIVKDFTWTQTAKSVNIRVPLKSVNREKVDLFTTDSYIKAHFNPFLLELFLLYEVDNNKSKCIINDDLIVLDLYKKEEINWDTLEKDMSKEEKMKERQEIHKKSQEQAKQEFEDKTIKKSQMDRFSVQQAMELDTKQHDLMDSRRDYETKKAMDGLEEWKNNMEHNNIRESSDKSVAKIRELTEDECKKLDEENNSCCSEANKELTVDRYNKVEEKINTLNSEIKQVTVTKPIARRPIKTPVKSEYIDKKKQEISKRVLPKLRETVELEITHTPRTFPTPSRESTADEEQAWLRNITLARRATGFVSEDLRPEEQDPQWCKEKGDEFFRNGNFLGAISAYTHGIKLSEKLPSLYANRSATHFALGNFNKAINDCSTALDLMKPPCESNRRSRAKCIARRAASLARLGRLNNAIGEMKAAAKLLPDDENIKKDIYDMERAWEQNPDSD